METAPSLPPAATPAVTTAATEAATEATAKIEASKDTVKATEDSATAACAPAEKEEAVGAVAGVEEITKYEDSTVEYVLDGKSMGEGKLKITTRFCLC